jgi:hypothetical protein
MPLSGQLDKNTHDTNVAPSLTAPLYIKEQINHLILKTQ